ncbi:MAG: hypothetical protein PWR09_742 [Archaeoglobi archaeon]|nr:hypothetical protein [Archaeoglobi archaeon]
MRKLLIIVLALLVISLSGCVEERRAGELDIKLNFTEFPKRYTLEGENISPRIERANRNHSREHSEES